MQHTSHKLKILVVDDSRIFRSLMDKILSKDHRFEVIGSVWDGHKALEFIRNKRPDLVTLDVEMPGMDGIETLRNIQKINQGLPEEDKIGVLMVSALTQTGARITLEALELGAFDYICKQQGDDHHRNQERLQGEVLSKIRAFATKHFRNRPAFPPAPNLHLPQEAAPPREVQAILIGASTGGPKALASLLPDLTRVTRLPILVVLHMPAFFSAFMAESMGKKTNSFRVICCEGNEPVRPETLYLAPGGRHLLVRRGDAGQITTTLNDQPPEEGCCPSVSVLFRSAAHAFNGPVVAIVLTGMGNDGSAGLPPLKRAGATIIAQDEESSVVWGMPGNAVATGCVDRVVPLGRIAESVEEILYPGKRNGR